MSLLGSGKGKLIRKATRSEELRNAQADFTTGRVNALFTSPEHMAQRNDFLSALRTRGNEALDRSFADNSRQQKFALARSGLTGGSADVDSQRRLIDTLTRGRLGVEDNAQSSFADLLGSDEATRAHLVGTATGGVNIGAAAQQAAQSMQGTIAKARANMVPNALQGIGEDFAGAYKTIQENASRRRGLMDQGVTAWG